MSSMSNGNANLAAYTQQQVQIQESAATLQQQMQIQAATAPVLPVEDIHLLLKNLKTRLEILGNDAHNHKHSTDSCAGLIEQASATASKTADATSTAHLDASSRWFSSTTKIEKAENAAKEAENQWHLVSGYHESTKASAKNFLSNIQEIQTAVNAVEKVVADIAAHMGNNQALYAIIRTKTLEIEQITRELNAVNAERDRTAGLLEDANAQNERLDIERIEALRGREDANAELKRLEAILQSIILELDELNEKLKQENARQQATIANLHQGLNISNTNLLTTDLKLGRASTENAKLMADLAKQNRLLEMMAGRLDTVNAENNRLSAQCNNAERNLIQAGREIIVLKQQLNTITEDRYAAKARITQLTQQLNTESTEQTELTRQLADMRDELEDTTSDLTNQTQRLTQDLTQAQQENKNLKLNNENLRRQLLAKDNAPPKQGMWPLLRSISRTLLFLGGCAAFAYATILAFRYVLAAPVKNSDGGKPMPEPQISVPQVTKSAPPAPVQPVIKYTPPAAPVQPVIKSAPPAAPVQPLPILPAPQVSVPTPLVPAPAPLMFAQPLPTPAPQAPVQPLRSGAPGSGFY